MIVPVGGLGGEAARELKLSVRPCASAWEELKTRSLSSRERTGISSSLIGPQSGQGETYRGPTESDRRPELEKYHKVARK